MSSREQEFAAKLKGHLDRSAEDLRPGLAYRLQAARAEALARLEGSTSTVPMGGLAGAHGIAGGGASFGTPPRPQRSLLGQARFWIGILAIAAAAFGYHEWTVWTVGRRRRGTWTPRSSPPTCRSMPIWTGDSRIGFRPLTKTTDAGRGPSPRPLRSSSCRWRRSFPSPRPAGRISHPRSGRCWRRSPRNGTGSTPSASRSGARSPSATRACRPTNSSASSSRCARGRSSPRRSAPRHARSTSRSRICRRKRRTKCKQRWEQYQKLPPEKKRELAAQPPAQGRPVPGQSSTAGRIPAPAMKPPPQLQPGEAPPAR